MLNHILTALVFIIILGLFLARIIVVGKIKHKKNSLIIIPVNSKTTNLASVVKAYYWEEIFENENFGREILLVETEESINSIIAEKLTKTYSIVNTVKVDDLGDYLKTRENTE